MAKKEVVKEVEDFNVEILNNGFVIGYSGRTEDDDYAMTKLVLTTEEDLFAEIRKVLGMS